MHSHIDTRVRLPEDCESCKKLWGILAAAVPGVEEEIEYGRYLRAEYSEEEMLHYLTRKADHFQIEKWHR